jgi:DNA-binding response OmpR family regulator
MALTLLVVDDHPSLCRLLELIVGEDDRFGACLTAESGDAAVQRASEHQPDVVVLDADLGGQDGLALIPSLRAASHGVVVAVFSSTAYVSPVVAERAGADTFIPKGTDLDELLDQLAALAGPDRTIELRDPVESLPRPA